MIVVSININDDGSSPERKRIRRLCLKNQSRFIGIQETKVDKVNSNLIHSLWGNESCDFAYKKSQGNPGSIIAIWDSSIFKNVAVTDGDEGFLAIHGEWIKLKTSCLLVVVYAPQDLANKSELTKNEHLIDSLKQKINVLEEKAENGSLDDQDMADRLSHLKTLEDLEHLKNLYLKQKAKVNWAIEGDENSKFFHGIINIKFSRSRINDISLHRPWVTDPILVQKIENNEKC
ncbi:RNA-directed DNA polymerase, eukaryota [Tanacetum coccineum]